MKTIFISIIAIVLSVNVFAQMPRASKIKSLKAVNQGEFVNFNPSLSDTMSSADTLVYKVSLTHTNQIVPYIIQKVKRLDSTANVTITFWESVDNSTWYAIQAWTSLSNFALTSYSKTASVSANISTPYLFDADAAFFSSRYFAIRYISATKTGFHCIPYGTIKFNIK